LIKGGEALQRAGDVTTVILDKTGTVTDGRPTVTDVVLIPGGRNAADMLRYVASVERSSEHPLGDAIVAYAKREGLTLDAASSFQSHTGGGVSGTVDERAIAVGNEQFMHGLGVDVSSLIGDAARLATEARTPVYVAIDRELAGIIGVADPIKPTTPDAIRRLRAMGLSIVMLTGDNANTASAIARSAGIDVVVAGVLPEGKVAEVKRRQSVREVVAMVGDGINDAPALAQADVGIAMGTGTDIASEAGDVVLMRGDLGGVVDAIALSRRTMRTMRQNLFWALVYNVIGIPIAAGVLYPVFGILLSPVLASAAMAFSSVSVVSNSLRLRHFTPA
jgi:P-type Cu+ transporter